MRDFIEFESDIEIATPILSMPKQIVKRKIQRECDFFHFFKDEPVNSEVTLNGRYHVLVVYTPEDNHFTIDSITVQDTILQYPVEFDVPYSPNNVYQHTENYIIENNLALE